MKNALFDAARRVIAGEGLSVQEAEGALALRVPVSAENGRFFVYGRVDPTLLRFFALAPIQGTPAVRGELCELVARINFGLPLATIELDVATGELRARSTVDGEALERAPRELLDACVRSAFWAAVAALDEALPALLRVISRGETAEQAYGMRS